MVEASDVDIVRLTQLSDERAMLKRVHDRVDAGSAGICCVFIFAQAHALAHIHQHGDLRIVNDIAGGAALDAEEEHDQASQCEAPQQHHAETRAARELNRIATVHLPHDGHEGDRASRDERDWQPFVIKRPQPRDFVNDALGRRSRAWRGRRYPPLAEPP